MSARTSLTELRFPGTVIFMRERSVLWLGLLALAAPACGSGNGASPFMPTTPVADACGMLALSTVQVLLPAAAAGSPLTFTDDPNIWTRGCEWDANGMSITLIVEGALTRNGSVVLDVEVDATSTSTRQATAVSGLGDKAVYLVNAGLDQILNARKGDEVVSVAAYNFTPDASEASLEPLVVEALAKL